MSLSTRGRGRVFVPCREVVLFLEVKKVVIPLPVVIQWSLSTRGRGRVFVPCREVVLFLEVKKVVIPLPVVIQWSLSTRDKLSFVPWREVVLFSEVLLSHLVLYSEAILFSEAPLHTHRGQENPPCTHFFLKTFQLQGILSDWNEDFNCSKTELEDISSRIDIYITINELRCNDLPLEMFKYGTFSYAKVHQCNYWNNNVLNDCTEYGGNNGSDISLLQYVQETVLLGSNLCRSDQLCAIPTSQAI